MSTSEIMTAKQLAGLKIGKESRFQKELVDRLVASASRFDEAFDGFEITGGERN